MDDELRNLHEAMVMKDRLRVLADLQASYWAELQDRGLEPSLVEQLVVDWSRQAYGTTFRPVDERSLDAQLDELLDTPMSASPAPGAQPPRPGDDPSSVPPGEPWLQLVQDVEDDASLRPEQGCEREDGEGRAA